MASEALRYFKNAKETLRKAPVEGDNYLDIKPVQEACGTAYLAILKAIDECLVKRGLSQKELPKSVEGYRNMIKKHLSIRNGRLKMDFDKLYNILHIAGYYRGLLGDTNVVKDIFKSAKAFINKIK
jgi:hypothetical protein|tara:strand:- start:917 stop:1294 length:378 start_codon:yes stop_codon:yes gene_type:complete